MEKVIETVNLTRKFGDFIAVKDLTFSVYKGEIFGFLGANGAGKTTAMRMLCGLLKPTSGKGLVAGFDISTQTEQVKKQIGYMSQKFSLYNDLTVKENFSFYGGVYGLSKNETAERFNEILSRLDMSEESNKIAGSLPPGWKQKLAFSLALLHKPEVVFLDEPTGGVDPFTRRKFWDLIYETAANGVTIFVTTHYMDEAEYCGRVSIMTEGSIAVIGTPEKLKAEYGAKNMDEVFRSLAGNIKQV
jgi:ABC-2 type transport system ATP-binding protein